MGKFYLYGYTDKCLGMSYFSDQYRRGAERSPESIKAQKEPKRGCLVECITCGRRLAAQTKPSHSPVFALRQR